MNDRTDKSAAGENLKTENDFLKMKLMLEQGARFGGGPGNDTALPPEIENQFLKNIMEFEKQYAEQKRIKVFDKIQKPAHFKPPGEIPESEIDRAWNELKQYLQNYHIELVVCSPNISARELYRFTLEELFECEMDDVDLPGMVCCFTYDTFHPDHEYENTNAAVDDCIAQILNKEPFEWMCHFKKENLRLNEYFPLTDEEFRTKVNVFKDTYEAIGEVEINKHSCVFENALCRIKGSYMMRGKIQRGEIHLKGNWLVEFEPDADSCYWYIVNVAIGGIEF